MKKILVNTILFFNILCYSQNSNKKVNVIFYESSHIYDTINNLTKNEKLNKVFNDKFSKYKSFDKQIFDSILKEKASKSNLVLGEKFSLNMEGIKNGTSLEFYTDLKTSKVYTKTKFNEVLYFIKNTEQISWKILDDRKIILNRNCQKATCELRGRNYIAWFSNEVPYSVGPWKLNGLPGAILLAYDDKEQVRFEAFKINFNNILKENDFFDIPTEQNLISREDFKKVKDAVRDNPELLNKSNITIKLNTETKPIKNKNLINNPLELN